MNAEKTKLGLLVGNRGFFPDHLCSDGRTIMLKVLEDAGYEIVALSTDDTAFGSVETYDDHRMAMSLALVGLRVPGVVILDPGCTSKTYPQFFADLRGLAGS